MKSSWVIRIAACLMGSIYSNGLALADTQSATFEFQPANRPGLFIDADGEGCCNFTAEIVGSFQLAWDSSTGDAWIGKTDAHFDSATVTSNGIAISDPNSRIVIDAKNWINGTAVSTLMPGFLSDVHGQQVGSCTFRFGPVYADDQYGFNYNCSYTILLSCNGGLITGQSVRNSPTVFFVADATGFGINASIRQVIPEPATKLILAAAVVCIGLHFDLHARKTNHPRNTS